MHGCPTVQHAPQRAAQSEAGRQAGAPMLTNAHCHQLLEQQLAGIGDEDLEGGKDAGGRESGEHAPERTQREGSRWYAPLLQSFRQGRNPSCLVLGTLHTLVCSACPPASHILTAEVLWHDGPP